MTDKKEQARLRKAASNAKLEAEGKMLKAFRINKTDLPRYMRFHAKVEAEKNIVNTQED